MKNLPTLQTKKGFTLIELLVVIGILAVLMAIVLIAVNPARQFAQANNSSRASGIREILSAVGQYTADNAGQLPPTLAGTAVDTDIDACTLETELATYIPAIPNDPQLTAGNTAKDCSDNVSNFDVQRDTNNRVTVTASETQIPPATADITVTR